jgi:hypothetical protein
MKKRSKKIVLYIFSFLVLITIICLSYNKIAFWLEYNDELVYFTITNDEGIEECEEYDIHFKVYKCSQTDKRNLLVLPILGDENYKDIYNICRKNSKTVLKGSGYFSKRSHKIDYYGCMFARKLYLSNIDTIYCSK